jgi:hypothetical protein
VDFEAERDKASAVSSTCAPKTDNEIFREKLVEMVSRLIVSAR